MELTNNNEHRKSDTLHDFKNLQASMDFLSEEFRHLDFTFHRYRENGHDYLKNLWPGAEDEGIMVCVYRGSDIHEPFHRHDFIYFNYAWRNDYAALSDQEGNLIRIRQGECYIGQPFSGYALRSIEGVESTIVGVLIKKEVFFRNFMQTFASDNTLFHFFLDPERDKYADRYLHFSFGESPEIRPILEMMILEYANRGEDTQQMLLSLSTSLYLIVTRTYRRGIVKGMIDSNTSPVKPSSENTADAIIRYIDDHFNDVSLRDLSGHFGYHPNYISGLLHRETGKTFSEILLEKRMEHALVLMKGTDLSGEEIAEIVGYGSTANYYKAFRRFYGTSPREYMSSRNGKEQQEKQYPLAAH